MKIFYEDSVLHLSDEAVEGLKTFVFGIMDAARKADPYSASCWNVCLIEFNDCCPQMSYAGTVDDLYTDGVKGPSLVIYHPAPVNHK